MAGNTVTASEGSTRCTVPFHRRGKSACVARSKQGKDSASALESCGDCSRRGFAHICTDPLGVPNGYFRISICS